MDKFGAFAAWVGIAAFFLAVPMAVVANLLTPKMSEWLATRSRSAQLAEIDRLKRRIAMLSAPFSEHLAFTVRRIVFAILFLSIAAVYSPLVVHFMGGRREYVLLGSAAIMLFSLYRGVRNGWEAIQASYALSVVWRKTEVESIKNKIILLSARLGDKS
jgi:hypothetical protein